MPTVLITGASRGIGRGFVERFGEAGWRVISTCRDPASAELPGEVHPLDYDAWAEVVAVDALAPIRIAEALVGNVAASERKLMVFISSMMGSITQTNSGDAMIYRSAKACLNAAVNVLGNGLRSRGIACVLFHPRWVRTDMGGASAAIDAKTSVRGMFNVIDRLKPEENGRFINYDGFDIPW